MRVSPALLATFFVVSVSFEGAHSAAFFVPSTTAGTTRASSSALFAKPKVFIDGEAGTTGLQVRDRIEARDDLELISIDFDKRKDEAERKKLINEADVVILCKFPSSSGAASGKGIREPFVTLRLVHS